MGFHWNFLKLHCVESMNVEFVSPAFSVDVIANALLRVQFADGFSFFELRSTLKPRVLGESHGSEVEYPLRPANRPRGV